MAESLLSTRRGVIVQAALGALALATPASLAALFQRNATDRFLLVELTDGELLALDLEDQRRAYRLTPGRLSDGTHALAESGAVTVEDGRLTGVRGQAKTRHYELEPVGSETLIIRRRDRDLPAVQIHLPRRG